MSAKYTLFSILICVVLGGAISAVSSLRWASASCLVMTALLANGALATWEDSRPGGFENPDGDASPASPWPILWPIVLAVGVALVGAFIQFG
jgi:hypothetical protein